MKNQVDLRAALDELPRYHTAKGPYRIDGRYCVTNTQITPLRVDKLLRKLMDQVDSLGYPGKVERVNVNGFNLFVLHRHLRVKSLKWLYRKNFVWQEWPREKLPIILKYRKKLIMWNGHHRCTFCRLAQRKLRALTFDLDKFFEWKRANPNGNPKMVWKTIPDKRKNRA